MGTRDCSTIYVRNELAHEVQFRFTGHQREIAKFKADMKDWYSGGLAKRLNASAREVDALQKRAWAYAQGICSRATRIYVCFRSLPTGAGVGDKNLFSVTNCASCGGFCGHSGCKGCLRPFCTSCFKSHRGTAPTVQWMFDNAGFFRELAKADPLRWSNEFCINDAITDLTEYKGEDVHPICVRIYVQDKLVEEHVETSRKLSIEYLRRYLESDKQEAPQPTSLVSFVKSAMDEES